MRRVVDPEQSARIGDPGARELLRDVGLPVEAMKIFRLSEDFPAGPRTWAQQREVDPGAIAAEFTPERGDWLLLGKLLSSDVALDPADGRVYRLPEVGGEPTVVNRSLEAFLGFLCAFDEAAQACDSIEGPSVDDYADFAGKLGRELEDRLRAIDPDALDDPEEVWENALFEISEGMW